MYINTQLGINALHAVRCSLIHSHLDRIMLWSNELAEEVVQHAHHSVHHCLNHHSPMYMTCVSGRREQSGGGVQGECL